MCLLVSISSAVELVPFAASLRDVVRFGFRRFLEKRKLRKGNGEHLIEATGALFSALL